MRLNIFKRIKYRMEISGILNSYKEAEKQLVEGRFVRCMVLENNMRPFLKEGVDEVLLCPMRHSEDKEHYSIELLEKHNKISNRRRRNSSVGENRTSIRRRDIVLCRTNTSEELRLMRVVHVYGTLLLLRGDASYMPYESATVSDVVGVVLSGTYMGGHTFRTTSKKWRYSSKAWTLSYKMRKYYKKLNQKLFTLSILMLTLCAAEFALSAQNDSTSATRRFGDNTDLDLQMRGSFNMYAPEGGEFDTKFRFDNLRWKIDGTFGGKKQFYFQFRQNLSSVFNFNSVENLIGSVNYAFLTWRMHENFSVTAGKQVFAYGGFEFNANPVNVMQFSDFGGSGSPYEMGVMPTVHINDDHTISVQMASLHGVSSQKYYNGGLPSGVEATKAAYLYSLNWTGNFLQNDALQFRYGLSWGQQAKERSMWVATLGQMFVNKYWMVYLDFDYSRQALDYNNILSGAASFSDGVARTIENVDYATAVAYVHFMITPSWRIFVKGSREYSILNQGYTAYAADGQEIAKAEKGIARASWNGQFSIQYLPTKDPNFRIFAHYNYYNIDPGLVGSKLGIQSSIDHRISLGVIYVLNVL